VTRVIYNEFLTSNSFLEQTFILFVFTGVLNSEDIYLVSLHLVVLFIYLASLFGLRREVKLTFNLFVSVLIQF
jgi:hypothetical protein